MIVIRCKIEKNIIVVYWVHLCMILISALGFCAGLWTNAYNIALGFLLLLYLEALIFYCEKIRRRCIQLIFHIVTWVFLISRPTISMLRGKSWWYFNDSSIHFALTALFLTLLLMQLGTIFAEWRLASHDMYRNEHQQSDIRLIREAQPINHNLRVISAIAFCATMFFSLLVGLEKISFASMHSYTDYYTEYSSSLPYAFITLAGMMPYMICIYLSTMPKKKRAFIALAVYVVSTVPMLIVGARGDTVLAVIFAFVYYVIRDYLDGTRYWIGRKERIAIAICLPLALLTLGLLNYMRDGAGYSGNVLSLIVDFFFKQGVSFDVLCMGYAAIPFLPSTVSKVYTFGGILDYFEYNNFAQKFFGAISLGTGNSVTMATYSNSFAHSMSYVAHSGYLSGHGYGSSYLLETYADFGYVGLALFSFLLAVAMACMIPIIKRSRFGSVIVLCGIMSLFLVPRAGATDWLNFLVYKRFWLCVLVCYIPACMMQKTYKFRYRTNKRRESVDGRVSKWST